MNSLAEHFDVVIYAFSFLLTIFLAVLSWFVTSTLAKIDANQAKLFDTVSSLATQLARLQGEHEAMKKKEGVKMPKNKRQIAEDLMVDLLSEIAENLLKKVKSGEATHQDISNAIKLLNNNGITVAINKGQPLGVLQESLPFHSDYAVTN